MGVSGRFKNEFVRRLAGQPYKLNERHRCGSRLSSVSKLQAHSVVRGSTVGPKPQSEGSRRTSDADCSRSRHRPVLACEIFQAMSNFRYTNCVHTSLSGHLHAGTIGRKRYTRWRIQPAPLVDSRDLTSALVQCCLRPGDDRMRATVLPSTDSNHRQRDVVHVREPAAYRGPTGTARGDARQHSICQRPRRLRDCGRDGSNLSLRHA